MSKTFQGIKYTDGDARPICLRRRSLMIGECRATTRKGKPCHCYPIKGQVFCKRHLEQGYALFTLAVIQPTERTNQ